MGACVWWGRVTGARPGEGIVTFEVGESGALYGYVAFNDRRSGAFRHFKVGKWDC